MTLTRQSWAYRRRLNLAPIVDGAGEAALGGREVDDDGLRVHHDVLAAADLQTTVPTAALESGHVLALQPGRQILCKNKNENNSEMFSEQIRTSNQVEVLE